MNAIEGFGWTCFAVGMVLLLVESVRVGRKAVRHRRAQRRREELLEGLAQDLTEHGMILLFYDRMHGLEHPLPKERKGAP